MAKVLLVEDDNNLREIYQARLTAEGYDIVSAQNGEEALVLAKQHHPDLVISDVMMPRISGFEMLDILRNTDELRSTKVIMLTALGQAEDRGRADNLGADKYLVKSQVTLEDIVSSANELLDTQKTDPSISAAVPAPEPAAAPAPEPQVAPPVTAAPAAEQPPAAQGTPSPTATSDAGVPVQDGLAAEEAALEAQLSNSGEANNIAAVPSAQPAASPAPEPVAQAAAAPNASDDAAVDPSVNDDNPLLAAQKELTQAAATGSLGAVDTPAADNADSAEPSTELLTQEVKPTESPALAAPQISSNTTNTDTSVPADSPDPAAASPDSPAVVAGKKVIQPLNSAEDKPNIQDLLAKEEAAEAAANTPQPTTPVTPNTTAVHNQPAPKPPTNEVDPNSIAL